LHRVFDTETDRLVFDVGHQCYPHKMLTGRRKAMATLRQYGGIAGFPKPEESCHDAFIAGHASNSVAVALGMARARDVAGEDYQVIAVIGDGALTGGLAYEGLSNAGEGSGQILVILNDNGMSIAPNVGGMADYLAKQRLKPQYLTFKKWYRRIMNATGPGRGIYRVTHRVKQVLRQNILPCSMFENMGFSYLGPVNGHDVAGVTRALRYARELGGPVLLHVKTVKGKGFLPAETNPGDFHGVSAFDSTTGKPVKPAGENFSSAFGTALTEMAKNDRRICAITAAMTGGTGLDRFQEQCPEQFFDVSIAEGCAVSMAAGMAKQGAVPVFAVYSTFLQRAYDMLLHDVSIGKQHVVLGVDRAGLVGEDGETHQGLFDVGYLDSVPGMTVFSPSNYGELCSMLRQAVYHCDGPAAVRYPRGGEGTYREDTSAHPCVTLRDGDDVTLVGYGILINEVLGAADLLEQAGIHAQVIKLNRITPLDPGMVLDSVRRTGVLVVAEDCARAGSVGSRLAAAIGMAGVGGKICLLDCGDGLVTHGAVARLRERLGLDKNGIAASAREVLGRG